MEYEFHGYCALFPEADEKTLADMAADIKENGLNEPIILYEGKILDGRNRYLACQQAEIEPTFKEYLGEEPLQYVISRNLHRRHLNESQRAMLAQKIWKMAKSDDSIKVTQADVQKQFKVSASTVRKAARVSDVAIDDIKEKVAAGTLSLNKAADVVKKAHGVTGIRPAEKITDDEKERLHVVQSKIMNDEEWDIPEVKNANAEEFNQAVLSGVYDGKRYRRDIQEIQAILAKMETLPTLFNDAIALIGTLEQEKMLVAALDMMINSVKKAAKKFQSQSVSYDDVLTTVAGLMDERFKLPEVSPSKERELVEQLKLQYQNDCSDYLREATDMKKRIKSGAVPSAE